MAAAFAEVEATFGGYEILIANAGVSTMQHALDLTDDEWDHNFNVNARGIFLTNQIAARRFKSQGKGVIVNTASLAAKVGAPLLAHYSASKFAVLGWTQALARELAPLGVRVNAVCPGFVKTGMQEREVVWEAALRGVDPERVIKDYIAQTPLGRLEQPEDVADVVVFLCSELRAVHDGPGRQRDRRRLHDLTAVIVGAPAGPVSSGPKSCGEWPKSSSITSARVTELARRRSATST